MNITEMTREKLTGTDFFDYFTEPQKAREVYKEVFAKGFVADYPLTIKDGKLTDVLFNGSVYKDEEEMFGCSDSGKRYYRPKKNCNRINRGKSICRDWQPELLKKQK